VSLVMSLFLLAIVSTAGAEIIYVDDNASLGGDGQTWGTAYKYLQDALYKPPSGGDQIWVAEGTYYPDEDEGANVDSNDRTETFQLINGVAIYGGFAGGESSLDERNWRTNETILSGDLNGDDCPDFTDYSENSYHIVIGSGTNATAVLDGFTVTAGNANGSYPNYYGGGIYVGGGSPTIRNCTFSKCLANRAGGMYIGGGYPIIINCTFFGNSVGSRGGGLWNYFASPSIINCIFIKNTSEGHGGAIYDYTHGQMTITNCLFIDNSANARSGGIESSYGTLTMTNCILWGNTDGRGMGESAQISRDYGARPGIINYCCIQGWTGTYGGIGNIGDYPLFIDPDNEDYHLLPDSPCIDAGDPNYVAAPNETDLDGNPRIIGGRIDMGAYEYGRSIFVDADATGSNDGSSWVDAFTELRDALSVAAAYPDVNEIRVAEGIYKPDQGGGKTPGDRTATFQLINGVGLYGGYAGYGAADPNERDWRTNETILSGDINTPGNSDNSYHVVMGINTEPNAVLDGFTITAGNANSVMGGQGMGGGMINFEGSPTVTNCTFSGNSALRGGGMYNDSGSPMVVNCTFSRNSAADVGGGMSNYNNSGPTVTNCTFSGNSAAYDGGGMDNENSSPTVTNCAFIGNSATGDSWGGGMCNANESDPTVTNCTFSGNSAYMGGGMYNDEYDGAGSNPTLTNCILWGNTAPTGPQIYSEAGSSPTINYSDVQGGWGSGTGNIDDDPLFIGPDGLDGIPGTADDEEDNVHLRGYSPCINAGDPGGDYSGQVDVDNQPRVAYGRVDMGADEVFPIAGDFEPDGDVDFGDFAIFANHWLLGP